jgi:hypothetical protein
MFNKTMHCRNILDATPWRLIFFAAQRNLSFMAGACSCLALWGVSSLRLWPRLRARPLLFQIIWGHATGTASIISDYLGPRPRARPLLFRIIWGRAPGNDQTELLFGCIGQGWGLACQGLPVMCENRAQCALKRMPQGAEGREGLDLGLVQVKPTIDLDLKGM